MSDQANSRRFLCRWVGWFFVANTILYFSIGLNYLFFMPNFNAIPLITLRGMVIGWSFMLTGLLGQSAVFAFAVCFVTVILTLCYPRKWFVVSIAVALASAMGLFLIVDSIVYHLYRYHLAGVVWQIIQSGAATQILALSWVEYTFAAAIAIVLLLVELCLALLVWRWFCHKKRRHGWLVGLVFAACLFISYMLTLSVGVAVSKDVQVQSNEHVLVMEAQIIPYYNNILGLLLPGKKVGIQLQTRDNGYFVQNPQINKPLQYPLHSMQCEPPKKPYNIVIIVLDAWRFDMLNSKVTPNIYKFAKKSWIFKNNLSGGNSTRPGIFSLFYSIPPNYWTAMLKQRRGPVFIHQLLKSGYQMGIFQSGSMHYPALDKTVFREVKHLKVSTPGAESFDRDRKITKEFKYFIKHLNLYKPFFSFVFYDETHNYCESSANYPKPFHPAVKVCNRLLLNNKTNPLPYLNRYRNAAHFDDALTGEVLKTLKSRDLLKNTIVIITADHGEEFNDSHQGYWGHAIAYTPWQIHTPMVIYWPHEKPDVYKHFTSHYDIVPTLMTKALGCTNPISDYSVGVPIRNIHQQPFIISGSYIDYAIIDGDRVTRIYPEGNYAIESFQGSPIPQATLNMQHLERAFKELSRYFK